ncbi:MAG: hypothetical protein ACI8YQ_000257 [Polaribacter sp.]|jgi:hypothetical protein
MWIFSQLFIKSYTLVFRLIDVFLLLPKRLGRLLKHLGRGLRLIGLKPKVWEDEIGGSWYHRLGLWWMALMVYVLDCLGVGEIYETISAVFKYNTRPLHPWEIEMARTIYDDNINYKRVRIDDLSMVGPKQGRFCYVSFYLVNSWGEMRNSTLIHELMHVWQYERYGALYMVQAIRAQNTALAYDYGGLEKLKAYLAVGKKLKDFNPEQQADIITDYFLIKNGNAPPWGCAGQEDLSIYEKFIEDLDKGKKS